MIRGLAVLLVAASWVPSALAEEVPPTLRKEVETAFADGRLEDLEAVLVGVTDPESTFPVLLRDGWWRPRPFATGGSPRTLPAPPADREAARKLRRMLVEPRRGVPQLPDATGYPLIEALILDRIHREALGAAGLPEASPLMAHARDHWEALDADSRWMFHHLAKMMKVSYGRDERGAASVQLDRQARSRVLQNQVIFLACLGSLLVLSFFGAVLVARRTPTDAETSAPARAPETPER